MLMSMKLPIAPQADERQRRVDPGLAVDPVRARAIPKTARIAFSQPVSVFRKPIQTSVLATSGIWIGM